VCTEQALSDFLCFKATVSEKVFPCNFCRCFIGGKGICKADYTMGRAYLGSLLNIILLLLLSSNIAYCHLTLERVDGNRKLHFSGHNKFGYWEIKSPRQ